MSESAQSALPSPEELVLECWAIANTIGEHYGQTMRAVLPFLPDHLISEVFETPRANWPFLLSSSGATRIPETLAVRLWDIGRAHERRDPVRDYLGPCLPDAKIRNIVENLAEIDESERAEVVEALTGAFLLT
jgi:hypothetical protein